MLLAETDCTSPPRLTLYLGLSADGRHALLVCERGGPSDVAHAAQTGQHHEGAEQARHEAREDLRGDVSVLI